MRKRFLALLIPSIILLVIGLLGVGFGSYFIGSAYNTPDVGSLGEAVGMAFGVTVLISIGASVLIVSLLCIVIGTPLFIGGLSTYKKDKKTYLENKGHNERVVEKS